MARWRSRKKYGLQLRLWRVFRAFEKRIDGERTLSWVGKKMPWRSPQERWDCKTVSGWCQLEFKRTYVLVSNLALRFIHCQTGSKKVSLPWMTVAMCWVWVLRCSPVLDSPKNLTHAGMQTTNLLQRRHSTLMACMQFQKSAPHTLCFGLCLAERRHTFALMLQLPEKLNGRGSKTYQSWEINMTYCIFRHTKIVGKHRSIRHHQARKSP